MLLPEGIGRRRRRAGRPSPTKLIRIAAMVRALLDEARRAPLDDAGRRSLKEIHERSIHELQEILSPDLRQELSDVTLPFSSETPSDSELRIAQAQLVGWLEGLFHGIQATLFTQQMQAQRQFEDMRNRRSLDVRQRRRRAHPRRVPLDRDDRTRAVGRLRLGTRELAAPRGRAPARRGPTRPSSSRSPTSSGACRRSCSRARRDRCASRSPR